jgi:hypothetical protein
MPADTAITVVAVLAAFAFFATTLVFADLAQKGPR